MSVSFRLPLKGSNRGPREVRDYLSTYQSVVPAENARESSDDGVLEHHEPEITTMAIRPSLPFLLSAIVLATRAPAEENWHSRLYPANWAPAFTDAEGRFLHDFSYAGYHYGERSLPKLEGKSTFDVVAEFGADNTGKADATKAIQSAIDAAESKGGGLVLLPAGLYRCDGILTVDAPGVVLRGAGGTASRVFFTSSKGLRHRSHIAFVGRLKYGRDVPLVADAPNRSRVAQIADAGELKRWDEVSLGWVITDEFVAEHKMTGTWKAFNGKWRPFFRRTIVSVDHSQDPVRVTLDVPLRYPCKMRDKASLRQESGYLRECGIEDIALSNAVSWEDAWAQHGVHAVRFHAAKDCWAKSVVSLPSPLPEAKKHHLQNCGIKVLDSKRVTIADCHLERPQNRGGGGCGYLFEISRSSEILTRDCTAIGGRHNFIQNWDFGTSGCVWLRCLSEDSRAVVTPRIPIGLPAFCEYHHSLAMACLVDQCTLDDGWYGGNRRNWSSGAGTTVTQSIFWNTRGAGQIGSWQFGLGYVVGTTDVTVKTQLHGRWSAGSEPADYTEGLGKGDTLVPQSLYEDQLKRRLGR